MGIVNRSEDDVVVDSSLPSDSLSSKQFATIVDVLSEGEIEGFPSAAAFTKGTANYNKAALKDVYLGKTPVLRASADPTNTQPTDFNFQDVEFEPRFGTNNQTFIPGITNIETETNVNVKVEADTPVSRQITNSSVNALRVTLKAFIFEFVICLDIGVPFSTFEPTVVSDSILAIPEINV